MYRLKENTKVIQPGQFFGDEVMLFKGLITSEQASWVAECHPERVGELLEEVRNGTTS